MTFAQHVGSIFGSPTTESFYQPSLTEYCKQNKPKKVLEVLASGEKADAQTFLQALKKTYEALQACGGSSPADASEEAAAHFYAWESVLNSLLGQKIAITSKEIGYGILIGRGWKEKLESLQSRSS